MKTLNESYNLYPMYETVEVVHLVVKSGILSIGKDSKERVIIKGDPEAIACINRQYNQNLDANATDGHIGYFDDREFIFPEGHSFNVREIGYGKLMVLSVYKEVLIGYNGKMVSEDPSCDGDYPAYIIKQVDSALIKE